MKKISYILQFNAFMDKRFDDELSPAASLLYMIIFSEFNRLHWRDEWIYISSRMLILQMGNHSNSTISRNLKKLGVWVYRNPSKQKIWQNLHSNSPDSSLSGILWYLGKRVHYTGGIC